MSCNNDGGPAFPASPTQDRHMNTMGMTLRDWFAGQAMKNPPCNLYEVENNAEWAYKYADAMIKARKK